MKKIITINGIEFTSRTKVEDYARQISKSNLLNQRLSEKDAEFMLAYFQEFHHDWLNKNGVGIDYFYTIKTIPYGNIGFMLARIDDTHDDISYTISKIIQSNPKNDFIRALRYLIRPQIDEFKNLAFKDESTLICPFRKTVVTKYNCHVDHHEPTFNEIANNYILERNITEFDNLVKPSSESGTEYLLVDDEQKKDFYAYHKQHAKLRILSKIGNLSDAKKQA